jgi:hypothetical protein
METLNATRQRQSLSTYNKVFIGDEGPVNTNQLNNELDKIIRMRKLLHNLIEAEVKFITTLIIVALFEPLVFFLLLTADHISMYLGILGGVGVSIIKYTFFIGIFKSNQNLDLLTGLFLFACFGMALVAISTIRFVKYTNSKITKLNEL